MADFDYTFYSNVWHKDTPQYLEDTVAAQERMLAPILGEQRGRALDIGCGPGYTVLALEQLGFDAEGTEADTGEAEQARRHGATVTTSSDVIGFAESHRDCYQVITLLNVLEHLPRDEQIAACRAIRSMLRSDGRLVLEVPNATSPLAAHWLYQDWTHTNAFTTVSLDFVLLNAGFTTITYHPRFTQRPRLRPGSILRWLCQKVLRGMWRAMLVSEVGDTPQARHSPLDLNLLAVATTQP